MSIDTAALDRWITGGGAPPDYSQARCKNCGETWEDHIRGDKKYGAGWYSEAGVCPDEATGILDHIRDNEFEEIDEEEEREEARLARWEADRDER